MEPIPPTQRLGGVNAIPMTDMRSLTDISSGQADGAVAPLLAFDEFYDAHAEPIGHALELTLQATELAEDALSEAMTRALLKWKTVGRYDNPQGWVYRVAMNWARSWLRRRRLERERPLPGEVFSTHEVVDPAIAAALDQLSIDHRAVVVCRFHLDWSTAQTAQALNIAEGTVKSRLSRALDQLRAELGEVEEVAR